ncbi:M23 family metallopeptidase [Falsiroseomonas bella]|nr:M23 family metallopeptidase [Falsiroseomonas bella]
MSLPCAASPLSIPLRALGALGAWASAAVAEPVTFQPPLAPACISSPFGSRAETGPRASRFHQGIDIPAPAGAWVRAAAAGEVIAIRRTTRAGVGLEVELRHADGRVTRYAHLGTVAPALAGGQRRVAAGERIARIGRTGITYGTHLHLELLVDGQRVDPAPVFGLAPCPPPQPP